MNSSNTIESLEQVNDWLNRKLQLTEEQVREGEDVNISLTDENRHLKAVCLSICCMPMQLSGLAPLFRTSAD